MSIANKDEALTCLTIAQKHLDSANYAHARKFAKKSISLYETPEANRLLELIDKREAQSASSNDSRAHTQESEAGTRHRNTHASGSKSTSSGAENPGDKGKSKREWTPDQAAIVENVRKYKVTQYYEILNLKKDCDEPDVKKAYRKLALQLHPDKNGAPGADEAFKMVSKAFQVLSDSNLRAAYDSHGGDPESRSSGLPSAFRNARGGGGGGGTQFEGEISPEELFNMFFGGGGMNGMGGSPFGGNVFTFGPSGFGTTRVHTNFGGRRQQRQQAAQGQQRTATPPSLKTSLLQLLPLLVFFLMSFGGTIYNALFVTPPPADPYWNFRQSSFLSVERSTVPAGPWSTTKSSNGAVRGGVKYYVDPKGWAKHPSLSSIPVTYPPSPSPPSLEILSALANFEAKIERKHLESRWEDCSRRIENRDGQIQAKSGLFGFGADWEAIKKLRKEKIESCEEVRSWGVKVEY